LHNCVSDQGGCVFVYKPTYGFVCALLLKITTRDVAFVADFGFSSSRSGVQPFFCKSGQMHVRIFSL